MSRSDGPDVVSGGEGAPPPEAVAIAVAIAALWPTAATALAPDPTGRPDGGGGRWRTGGRRWARPTTYTWS